jgi:glycosyltransferase involved in cell wall biosynthesis
MASSLMLPPAGNQNYPRAVPWRALGRMQNKVLLIGYAPRMLGGVTTVMGLLCERIPCLELHVALCCYRPRWKSLVTWIGGLVRFIWRLLVAPPRVVQVVVGSPGDSIRTIPYILFGRLRGCSVCLHFHKNLPGLFDGLPVITRWLVLHTWRYAHAYCFLSRRLRDECSELLASSKPQYVIANPIAEDWLASSIRPYSFRTRDLVFVGRWSHEKGNDQLLSVIQLLDIGRPVQCDIFSDHVGTSPTSSCVFHGWLDRMGVQRVLAESKVLVLPSRAEAFPTVLLEAAACGTPFVSTTIAGIPDIAEDSRAGLLHAVGDIEGMRLALTQLLTDESLWCRCSRSGRQWVESLEVSKIVPQWHRLYIALGVPENVFTGQCNRNQADLKVQTAAR